MSFRRNLIILIVLLFSKPIFSQKSVIYENDLKKYDHALELYNDKAYTAAKHLFEELEDKFDNSTDYKANCAYYISSCAIRLNESNADELMDDFVKKYPTSAKRNEAFLNAGDYYFKTRKYAKALSWYEKASKKNIHSGSEDFTFKLGYSYFKVNQLEKANDQFVELLDSPKYGANAKYYYAYIAYKLEDYDSAQKYFEEVDKNANFDDYVPYYRADMNFKLGNFQKAIDIALPLMETARPTEVSEIAKIIGESYFNLGQYEEAIPYLKQYKGKRRKWNNTDFYILGYCYYKQGDYENAINNFNKIIDGKNEIAQNAYYHLAECYLQLDKKQEALNAFGHAASMSFLPKLKEDAMYNYAKLSYEIGNPYKSTPQILQEFLNDYPKSIYKKELENLIVSAYVTSKDYEGALVYLDSQKSKKSKTLYQKVSYFLGVQYFNEGDYNKSIEMFTTSLSNPINQKISAKATFWRGEANYKVNLFNAALIDFKDFIQFYLGEGIPEAQEVDYDLAYVYMKLKDYPKASDHFVKYIENNSKADLVKRNDAFLRLGDCYSMSKKYWEAMTAYNQAIRLNSIDEDYAFFQKSISYGYVDKNDVKIEELEKFVNKYPESTYNDDAYYHLANTYLIERKDNKALETYDKFLQKHINSPLVPKILIRKALVYNNQNKKEEAIDIYKRIVADYPKASEANEAVRNARQIYITLSKVDEYGEWVQTIGHINISKTELDHAQYESAEYQYLNSEYGKAIPEFEKYLTKYPQGMHVLESNFYLGESLNSVGKTNKSIQYFERILNEKNNEFTEPSLTRLSQIYVNKEDWANAIPVLSRLENLATLPQNKIFASTNLMKGYYETSDFKKAVSYADKILKQKNVEKRIISDAKIIIARAAFESGDYIKAKESYKEVEKIAKGKLKAEALYYKAYFQYKAKDYDSAMKTIQKIASDFSAHKYWGAKSLLIMAKIFNEKKDTYQATFVLEKVIQNFKDYNDVLEEARVMLNEIKAEAKKTNDSVKLENQ
ncbi:tetratricopeptide repeat protein [Aureivirga sp. CE67]|uniref:tetratricopeptide repeat protein n=1 Tax=Aureivirga sp. CE67 TaxID=1788983 RepID=UPI0018C95E68|nr:tetratricopeptide repeat protein [Aureivirga sp. CE67]